MSVYHRRRHRPVGFYGLGELTAACAAIKVKLWCLKGTSELSSGTQEANSYRVDRNKRSSSYVYIYYEQHIAESKNFAAVLPKCIHTYV